MASSYRYRLLQIALVVFGAVMLLLYPLALCGRRGGHGITVLLTSPITS
jgi:NADH:ubiquinone oxidoreductase subunit 3 (subunit A)